jgi:hypothetical protein
MDNEIPRLRRQSSLNNLTFLNNREINKRKYYSLNSSSTFLVKNSELEWDTTDLIELTESETWSNYDIDDYIDELKYYEFDFEQQQQQYNSQLSIPANLNYQLVILEPLKSQSVQNLTQKKFLCLKSKHLSLLNLNPNIKYCLNKKPQKVDDDRNVWFFRLSKFSRLLVYLERLIDKFKSIVYKKSHKSKLNDDNFVLLEMIDEELLKSYDIIE